MVGAQDEGGADVVGRISAGAPGGGKLGVDRRGRAGCAGRRGGDDAHQVAAAPGKAHRVALPLRRRVVGRGDGHQRQHRLDRSGVGGKQRGIGIRQHRRSRRKRVRAPGVPQQRGGLLQARLPGQRGGVAAPVEKPPVADQRQGRLQHRHAPVEGGAGHLLRPSPAASLGRKLVDGFRKIAALARVVGLVGLQQPAADVGVERLPRHAQAAGGLVGREIEGHQPAHD